MGTFSQRIIVFVSKAFGSTKRKQEKSFFCISTFRLIFDVKVFKEPLKHCQCEGYLMSIEPNLLFGNLEEVCQVSFKFCQEFHRLLKASRAENRYGCTEIIVKLFEKFSQSLSPIAAYQAYCINYRTMLEYLESLRQSDDRFLELEKVIYLIFVFRSKKSAKIHVFLILRQKFQKIFFFFTKSFCCLTFGRVHESLNLSPEIILYFLDSFYLFYY